MQGRESDCVLPDVLAQAANLPAPPVATLELLRLAQDEQAGLEDYSRVLASDPKLAARILALANSPPFRLGPKVTTLERATLILGMRTVQLMALAFSIVEPLPQRGTHPSFDYAGFWKRSLCTAVAARELGRLVGFPFSEEAFLCGLASHLGQLVLAECMPAEYAEVLERSSDWPSRETEDEVLGFDGAEIGGALLKAWGLPEPLYAPVSHCAAPEELPADASPSTRRLCHIVHAAALVARVLCDHDEGAALRDLHARIGALGTTAGKVDTLILALEPHLQEMAEVFSIDLGSARPHHEILTAAWRRMAEDVPLGVAASGGRARLDAALAREAEKRIRGDVEGELGLLLVEVLGFDVALGGASTEEALHAVERALRGSSRDSDRPVRLDERRLAVLVPTCTPRGLRAYAERIESALAGGGEVPFRVCVGGAHLAAAAAPSAGQDLLRAASSALAAAVARGPGTIEIRAL